MVSGGIGENEFNQRVATCCNSICEVEQRTDAFYDWRVLRGSMPDICAIEGWLW
jgi:hypothetical protein